MWLFFNKLAVFSQYKPCYVGMGPLLFGNSDVGVGIR